MADTDQVRSTGVRESLSLDGPWNFRHAHDGVARTANVPNPWQAEFSELRRVSGTATYSRSFDLPCGWADRTCILKFGAVSYFAEVRLNGELLGTHEGGYLPFEFTLPAGSLQPENTIEVTATLPNGDRTVYPDFPFSEIPHGKQSWYGPLGGIWQSVTLESRGSTYLTRCAIASNLQSGEVSAEIELSGSHHGDLVVSIYGPDGSVRSSGKFRASGLHATAILTVPNVEPWSPDAPNLYTLHVEVRDGEDVADTTRHSFGFRRIETRNGQFFLNGQPLYIRGALDQDYYPEGICTPPSLEFLEDQVRKAKALGLNLLRCHIKVPDPRYYEVADRLGILIWTEIPNVAILTPSSAQRLRDTMEGILTRDGNHPSIICWTIINEDWGTRLVEDASHRAWLKETFDWLKAKDPTRLVVDNSACIPNFHVKTDINDYHYYRSVPERRVEWEKLTQEFASGASWTYSPYGDAERRGDEPLVVSEFGVWGLPDPALAAAPDGSEPWWMETGQGWGDGAAYPHGVQLRFDEYRLDRAFGSFESFISSVQWYQFANLKYEIESMRAHAPIMGYVITELTDVHWEANGLMDLNRNPRQFAPRFAEINADIVIIPKLARYSGRAGRLHKVALSIATGGLTVPAGAQLAWSIDDESGIIEVPATGALTTVDLGVLEFRLPDSTDNHVATLSLTLSAGGQELARNSVDISVYGKRSRPGSLRVAATDGALALYAAELGYEVTTAIMDADVVLAHALRPADILAMQSGAHYLVLADGTVHTYRNLREDIPPREQPIMSVVDANPGIPASSESQMPNISLHPRHGTMWRGDWISSFSWIAREGAFASIPGGPMLDMSFAGVIPHHVMGGFRTWEAEGLVHGGVVVGWIHKPAATIIERRVGNGGLVATTFRLTQDMPGADPVATALFDAMVQTAAEMETNSPMPLDPTA